MGSRTSLKDFEKVTKLFAEVGNPTPLLNFIKILSKSSLRIDFFILKMAEKFCSNCNLTIDYMDNVYNHEKISQFKIYWAIIEQYQLTNCSCGYNVIKIILPYIFGSDIRCHCYYCDKIHNTNVISQNERQFLLNDKNLCLEAQQKMIGISTCNGHNLLCLQCSAIKKLGKKVLNYVNCEFALV